jgi:hypothetical protein
LDVESELWNIFSYYCVHGDAKEVQHLRRHHWLQLMRDIGLLGPQLGNSTPCALFRVIYTAETRGSVGSSGKMNYSEFLDALMNVAVRACRPGRNSAATTAASSASRVLDDVDPAALDASFVDLLATYILPRAKRWNTHMWQQHTVLLHSPDVVRVVRPFLKSLFNIFRFYAPDPHSQADGTASVLHLYLDYTGFKKVSPRNRGGGGMGAGRGGRGRLNGLVHLVAPAPSSPTTPAHSRPPTHARTHNIHTFCPFLLLLFLLL